MKTKTSKQDLQITELENKLARALADYANLERRFGMESSAVIKFANSAILSKLLDIRDHLAMASVQIKDQSLILILNSLDKLLLEEGVVTIKTDNQFDPTLMECHEQGAGEQGKVVKVIRPGYLLHGRVLRPARVTVGNGQINKTK